MFKRSAITPTTMITSRRLLLLHLKSQQNNIVSSFSKTSTNHHHFHQQQPLFADVLPQHSASSEEFTSKRHFAGVKSENYMKPSEFQIVDLKRLELVDETDSELVIAEVNRRIVRIQKILKTAPYIGGAFIRSLVTEARVSCDELEELVIKKVDVDLEKNKKKERKNWRSKVPEDFVEHVEERLKEFRGECSQLLYDHELL